MNKVDYIPHLNVSADKLFVFEQALLFYCLFHLQLQKEKEKVA